MAPKGDGSKKDFFFQNVGFPWCPSNFGGNIYIINQYIYQYIIFPRYGEVGEASDTVDGSEIPSNQLRIGG